MRFLLLCCVTMVSVLGVGCASSDNGGSSTGTGGTAAGTGGATAGSGGSTGSGGASTGSGGATSGTGGTIVGGSGGRGTGGSATDAAVDKPAATDGGGTDAATAAACAGLTTTFCDDFEAQTEGKAPTGAFTVTGAAGSVIVDGTKPYGGTKSLHIKTATPAPIAQLLFTKQFPMTDMYGRAMVFMSAVPTNSTHWDLLYTAFDNGGRETDWEFGGQSGVFELVCDLGNGMELDNSSKTKFPTGKWVCMQWHFKDAGAGMDNTYTVKADGVSPDKGDFTGAVGTGTKWPAGPWKYLKFGWEGYGSSNVNIELWADDLAFGAQEIPCPAMN